ncbi:formate dehydrogenase accessory sulfurtransferase FdhD [Vibrio sp. S4M6]|uniref:formate dehydrogenase accessory sulfurtransferase FdhD n=1 Tax=Vibrio sinus TaxID=2946865 RepID=UPI00202AB895|nr:formate dehydrogenase accessory sulfurtransferase FdhD [Vibrio sinus]MCL9782071.1 formate dehydrogenase accessory sulfurtransferase FdhD [Vibrio sinus]
MSKETKQVQVNTVKQTRIIRYQNGTAPSGDDDMLIGETPVAIEYNGIAYTVMMCTPSDLEEFAVGFSLTEGIIDHVRDIHDIEIVQACSGITMSVIVANRCLNRLKEKRRSLTGTTGCGVCGAEQLSAVVRSIQPVANNTSFQLQRLDSVLSALSQAQSYNRLTGASHAAAFINADGEVEIVFEDVGRHIALDKLIGWICRHRYQQSGSILVTSRASFEMVQKVAACGIEILLAVSAATSMAVELAETLNVTLCGYCRPGRMNVYSNPQRLTE